MIMVKKITYIGEPTMLGTLFLKLLHLKILELSWEKYVT